MKNTLIKLVVAAAVMLPYAVAAQTSSINAFSPYTMYGIGELSTPGSLPMRSMGGVGVASRNTGSTNLGNLGSINLLNPAAYSAMPQKSFLFNFGLEGQNFYNSQTVEQASKQTAYNTFNFHDIAFQLPLAKKLGLGFSLTPYSSVGYRTQYTHEFDPNDPVWGNAGRAKYIYQGEGDVSEIKLGVGWELFKNFSLGLAMQYYWGDIDRSYVMNMTPITGDGTFSSTIGRTNYSISSIKGQVGVQWSAIVNRKRALTFGATYDFGGDLNPDVTQTIYDSNVSNSIVKGDTTHMALVLPRQLAVGVYYQTSKWSLGLDYVYQGWGSGNRSTEMTGVSGALQTTYEVAYTNTSTVKIGAEYTPNRWNVRSFWKRWSYRAGFRYGNYNQTYNGHNLSQYAVTLGVGVPIRLFTISSIDVGVEYGRRGYNLAKDLGLVRQQYVKFSIGFSLFAGGGENGEYWFQRPKYE